MRYLIFLPFLLFTCSTPLTYTHDDVAKWQKMTLDFPGPETSEDAEDNPFVNYRLDVTFTNGETSLTVPGYYAADGNAAETGAESGNVWQVRFRPNQEGEWTYSGRLVEGDSIYMGAAAGAVVEEYEGSFLVGPPRPGETGALVRDHPRYLRWAETGDYFLKTAVNSPENLLAYEGFDGTYRHSEDFKEGESKTEGLHRYTTHEREYREGDPNWQNGKGKGLIGGLNYLSAQGVNGIYFLTMNINGDGKDVWPYTGHEERFRFDVSKLDQWERVFDHADSLGMMLHFVTAETENETLLDGGDTGPERSIYYRELVARFGHHRAVTWNLGEENGPTNWTDSHQTTEQQEQGLAWFEENDPWGHYTVIHTHPNVKEFTEVFRPLLGNAAMDGISLQLGNPYRTNEVTKTWIDLSAEAGAPLIMTIDEVGPWWRGLDPDDGYEGNFNQDSLRALTLWGNLMAGGAGVEWYYGAKTPENDLNLESWRNRERGYHWSAHARNFFEQHLPFPEMQGMNELIGGDGELYCFAKPGEAYAVFTPFGRPATLDLSGTDGEYDVAWYNPREGGELIDKGEYVRAADGEVELVPPGEGDWACLLRRR